ncbi:MULTISPECIES: Panacea domain-containing protein [Acinetobacter]|nr:MULTISPECIES: type II toxin-antitoxin system antitoxin SocA domain-containing protein [Acinetobacter]QSQ96133.1 SocA family protein [Acinetobacter indicus]UNW10874.1 Panacea domain-containing protein [Acinetobacter indicus]
MNNKYTAMDVANYIVWYANHEPNNVSIYSLSPLKLQKILYYIASEYFKKSGKRLFSEDFQKWQYGPVVKDVYHEFKSSGFHHIAKPKAILEMGEMGFSRKDFDAHILNGDTEFKSVAEPVIKHYLPWKAFDLVERTHDEEAWKAFESEIMKGIELTYSDSELMSAKTINDK